MTLVDWQINDAKRRGEIDITPYNAVNLQQVSYDVHLGNEVRISKSGSELMDIVDLTKFPQLSLPKGRFCLAHTIETLSLDDYHCAFLHGVSTVARNGLQIHAAGLIDNGFIGQITLEIYAQRDVWISAGMRIGQLEFRRTERPTRSYAETGRYQNQTGATEARNPKL
jgi:dCTP deaminase